MAHESDAQIAARTAHEQAYRDHKAPRGPAYRPIRARLLLQVEDREPVEVWAGEPEMGLSSFDSGPCFFVPPEARESIAIAAALTVEVRELLAEQRKHEDPTEGQ